MGLDGINYLVAVTQMKASEANDAALESKSKPSTAKTTSFDTYAKTVAETSSPQMQGTSSPQGTQTAQKKQRESLMTSILTNIANMKHESLKVIAQNLRG